MHAFLLLFVLCNFLRERELHKLAKKLQAVVQSSSSCLSSSQELGSACSVQSFHGIPKCLKLGAFIKQSSVLWCGAGAGNPISC